MKLPFALRRSAAIAMSLMAIGLPSTPHAEDIDLYVGGESWTDQEANVLIVLDNSTNWAAASEGWPTGKQGESELEALSEVLGTLTDNINVGLMMSAGSNGGYVRFAVREMNATNRGQFQNMLNTMKANFGNDGDNDDKVNTASIVYDNMMNAAFRYFNSVARFGTSDLPSGSQLDLRDYSGNSNSSTKQPAFPNALGNYSLSSSTATTYSGPPNSKDGCAKNFIIFIGNGYPNSAGAASDITNAASLVSISNPDVSNVSGGDNNRYADEWARFMYTYGVKSTVDDPTSTSSPKAKLINKIATYTIDVCKDSCDGSTAPKTDANRDQAKLLKSMAKVGGGKYFKSTSKAEIKNAMALIFAEIQAVNSVFASATLPISVNTQGTYENQVYIGTFRPDGGAKPRWYGNLKEYKFGRYCDADSDDKVDVDSTRSLVGGMITATVTGTATGTVSGTFSGTVTNGSGTTSSVSGTVTGTVGANTTVTLAASTGTSAGTTGSPAAGLGAGTVTGTITGTGTGTGSSTFTGTFNATPSVSGSPTATDERIGDDVLAPTCSSGSLKLYLADKNGSRAIDEQGNTGFIDLSARSYWTTDSSFWTFLPTLTGSVSDNPDGPSVERGGAAQRLRTKWASTATAPHPDGRKVYTCLGSCLGAAVGNSARDLYDSSNAVATSNTAVTTQLAAPSGAVSVTLSRSGGTVTATVASGTHAFTDGNSVVLAGVTGAGTDGTNAATDYNGTKTVTTGGSSTTFTYPITETPSSGQSGTATFSGSSVTNSITSIALSGTGCTSGACYPGKTITATLTAGGTVTGSATISGTTGSIGNKEASSSASAPTNFSTTYLNLSSTTAMTGAPATVVTYSVTTPAAPGNATGITATLGTASQAGMTGAYDASTNRFTISYTANLPVGLRSAAVNSLVTVSGSSDPKYNGLWKVVASANRSITFDYYTFGGCSPCTGATITSSASTVSRNVTITRTTGSTTATVTTDAPGFYATGNTLTTSSTVSISGTTGYNGNWTPTSVSHTSGAVDNAANVTTFTISPVTLGPAAAAGAVTATLSGAGSGPPTTSLITWMRGKDLWEDEDSDGSLTNVRASIHGDVLHARPVVVNYGGSTGIIGFYGSNDGYLRAVKGGLSDADGEEKWAFIPEEFMNYTKQARRYQNSELIRYPNTQCTVSPSPTGRNYFWDGPITAYQSDDLATTWIFAGMRRGGRSIYSLDVSNPDQPKLKWRISNTKINNTASTDYAELAQTWSEPKVIKLKGTNGGSTETKIALAFGAGYDDAVDDKPTGVARAVTKGRGVFIADADTGAKLHLLAAPSGVTAYSFAADVTPLDVDNDGYIDRIYAADTGGNIYRFDADHCP